MIGKNLQFKLTNQIKQTSVFEEIAMPVLLFKEKPEAIQLVIVSGSFEISLYSPLSLQNLKHFL